MVCSVLAAYFFIFARKVFNKKNFRLFSDCPQFRERLLLFPLPGRHGSVVFYFLTVLIFRDVKRKHFQEQKQVCQWSVFTEAIMACCISGNEKTQRYGKTVATF